MPVALTAPAVRRQNNNIYLQCVCARPKFNFSVYQSYSLAGRYRTLASNEFSTGILACGFAIPGPGLRVSLEKTSPRRSINWRDGFHAVRGSG